MAWSDAAGWLDAAVVGTRRLRGAPDERIEAMQAEERLQRLAVLRPTYDDDAMVAFPGGFLAHGPTIAPEVRPIRTAVGPARDLSWPSGYAPWHAEAAPGFAAVPENATASARLFRAGDRPGPTVIAIHGYGAGRLPLEQWVWPLRTWKRLGIDVVLPILPFHGRRGQGGMPKFPGLDPRFTNDGFRQVVHDLTALIAWLRAEGHGPIALAGMSLGGKAAALLATLIDDLAGALLVIPLASLADFALAHGRLGRPPQSDALHAALEAVYRPSSPFSRPPKLAAHRVRVVAARGDRITGIAHAERLAAHFGATAEVVGGSHLVQVALPWRSLAETTAGWVR